MSDPAVSQELSSMVKRENQRSSASNGMGTVTKILAFFSAAMVICVVALSISVASLRDNKKETVVEETVLTVVPTTRPPAGTNQCEGAKMAEGLAGLAENIDCMIQDVNGDFIMNTFPLSNGEQSGANISEGYKGNLDVSTSTLITNPYWMEGMCPVNVHWHLGAEHLSVGEFDQDGKGPSDSRRRTAEGVRKGHRCHHYNDKNPIFTTEYDWKHCVGMKVGETYEVHWPHSSAGACGTLDQYQTPFYDGVLCNYAEGIKIGVQGQVFTIVNDEAYYYPNLFNGMIVDGEMGKYITKYTGSTTGTSRDNNTCSQYTGITWQVDRKCHMISASTFDKMCADMKSQRDDMSDDLHAHGSRETVKDDLAANNHVNRKLLRN